MMHTKYNIYYLLFTYFFVRVTSERISVAASASLPTTIADTPGFVSESTAMDVYSMLRPDLNADDRHSLLRRARAVDLKYHVQLWGSRDARRLPVDKKPALLHSVRAHVAAPKRLMIVFPIIFATASSDDIKLTAVLNAARDGCTSADTSRTA